MTGEIMKQILAKFNSKMAHQKCHVLLLMGCHPQDLDFSNVKIVFFPPNTTSMLQPLDLGIIQNFKTHCRRFLLRYILASIDICTSASEVAGNITILNAIRWISKSWREVKPETITKCFRKAGISSTLCQPLSASATFEDPFDNLDNSDLYPMPWLGLMAQPSQTTVHQMTT